MENIKSNTSLMPKFGDLANLRPEKLQELETVLGSILALPVARETYSQIIDGKRIRTGSKNTKASKSPIASDKPKPSDRAMQQFEEIRTSFSPQGLRIDLQLIQNYQNALPGSREHLLRLLEIAAASVNALAGTIFAAFHPDTNTMPPEPREGHFWQFRATDNFYVDFYHTNYQLFEKYPFGLLNVVGYWAEVELFGGVVLFEHVKSGSEIINAFVHPQENSYAFQLSEKQLKRFASLGVAGNAATFAGAETVLPFAKESDARTELTFGKAGEAPLRIYKNEYDQPPVSYLPEGGSCVITQDDRLEKAMKFVQEMYPALFQDRPSLRDAYLPSEGASSSKEGPPSASKKGL